MPTTLRNTDILFNDGTTQGTAATAGSLVTTANVLSATAGASVGAVGTYAALEFATSSTIAAGSTTAGSGLLFARFDAGGSSGTPSGTWRAMGVTNASFGSAGTVFLRIS